MSERRKGARGRKGKRREAGGRGLLIDGCQPKLGESEGKGEKIIIEEERKKGRSKCVCGVCECVNVSDHGERLSVRDRYYLSLSALQDDDEICSLFAKASGMKQKPKHQTKGPPPPQTKKRNKITLRTNWHCAKRLRLATESRVIFQKAHLNTQAGRSHVKIM